MAQKKKRKKTWGFGANPQTLHKELQQFDRYIAQKQWLKAQETLEELEKRFSDQKEILESWLTLAYEKQDWKTYQQKALEYASNHPNTPDAYLILSSVCLQNAYPLLALEALEKFCEKFPNHPQIPEANETIEDIHTLVPEFLKEHGIEGEQALEIGKLTEQGRFLFESHQYAEASKLFEEVINLDSKVYPAFNNLSLIRCFEGDLTGAIALAQQVLESDPNNFNALGNLVRFYVLSGERELAQKYLNQLNALDNEVLEIWVKKAESLAFFGDWSGLVDLGKEAESSDVSKELTALFWHFIAVGYANSGQEAKARRFWKKSLKLSPGFDYAQKNLDNLNQPLKEQHTPWAFEINDWFSFKFKEEMNQIVAEAEKHNHSSQSIAESITTKNPHLITLTPLLLKQGSPIARNFVTYLATLTKIPELVESLKEFAFGKEGSDKDRFEVLQYLSQKGFIPSGNVTIWMKGEEQETLLMGMEINDQPPFIHSQKVQDLGGRALHCLKTENPQKAESLLIEALELEPSAPDLKFNLANAYLLQDREEEAYDLIQDINAEYPDYTFAATFLAHHHLKNEEIEKAEELIKPLLTKQQFHHQEFGRFAEIQIELAVKKRNLEAAKAWLNMWKELGDEDDPSLVYWHHRLEGKLSWLLK